MDGSSYSASISGKYFEVDCVVFGVIQHSYISRNSDNFINAECRNDPVSGCYNNSSSVDRGSKNRKLSNGSPAHVTNISHENRRYRSKGE